MELLKGKIKMLSKIKDFIAKLLVGKGICQTLKDYEYSFKCASTESLVELVESTEPVALKKAIVQRLQEDVTNIEYKFMQQITDILFNDTLKAVSKLID